MEATKTATPVIPATPAVRVPVRGKAPGAGEPRRSPRARLRRRLLTLASLLGLGGLFGCARTQADPAEPTQLAEGSDLRFAHTVDTSASPEAIWALWTNVDSWGEWDSGLRRARIDGELGLGTRGRLVPKRGFPSRFEISEWAPGEAYAFTTKLPRAELVVRRSFVEAPEGVTRFRHEVYFTGSRAETWAARLAPSFRRQLPPVMARLAELAEAGGAAP